MKEHGYPVTTKDAKGESRILSVCTQTTAGGWHDRHRHYRHLRGVRHGRLLVAAMSADAILILWFASVMIANCRCLAISKNLTRIALALENGQ